MILMRHPVARLISHYKWLYASGIETRSFRQAVTESGYEFDPERPVKGCHRGYLEFSSYAKWVPKWQRAFGASNVLLIKSEGLREDPVSVLDSCAGFLGVNVIQWSVSGEKNRTDDIVLKKAKPLAKVIRRLVPDAIQENTLIRPTAINIWNKMFVEKRKITPPMIEEKDIDWVNMLLAEHSDYYNQMFHDGITVKCEGL